jgi:hypothetical protein
VPQAKLLIAFFTIFKLWVINFIRFHDRFYKYYDYKDETTDIWYGQQVFWRIYEHFAVLDYVRTMYGHGQAFQNTDCPYQIRTSGNPESVIKARLKGWSHVEATRQIFHSVLNFFCKDQGCSNIFSSLYLYLSEVIEKQSKIQVINLLMKIRDLHPCVFDDDCHTFRTPQIYISGIILFIILYCWCPWSGPFLSFWQ